MPDQLFVFILIGFFAQIVDGALGMAFGVLCTTSLLAFGVAPAAASAMTHVTELFTTAASGASHVYHRNIDWHLVLATRPRRNGRRRGGSDTARQRGWRCNRSVCLCLSRDHGWLHHLQGSSAALAAGGPRLDRALRGARWRRARCCRRRRMGSDRDRLADWPRSRAAKGDRLNQSDRVPGHGHDFGDILLRARLV